MPPVQVSGSVETIRRVAAYHELVLAAPGVAASFRPGQFVALAVGGEDTSMLLRRCFSVYAVDPVADTVAVVFAVHGRGTAWLAALRPGDAVDVVGPLGRPFPVPSRPTTAVLVGGGYGSAPLFSLARALRAQGSRAAFVLGAGDEARLFGVAEARGLSDTVAVTTDDGSVGVPGRVSDVLPAVLADTGADAVYACGPMAMLAAVAGLARSRGIASHCAVEESMACGVGVCMTCVLPVVGDDGVTRMTRSCVEGPVFPGSAVRWDAVGTVPPGTLGAPATAGRAPAAGAPGSLAASGVA